MNLSRGEFLGDSEGAWRVKIWAGAADFDEIIAAWLDDEKDLLNSDRINKSPAMVDVHAHKINSAGGADEEYGVVRTELLAEGLNGFQAELSYGM